MTEEYRHSAEFIDIMIAPHWQAYGPVLTEALRGAPAGPVVDLGAGGGHGTRVIAQALPEAEILAVEPTPGLRAVLLARVNEDAGLRERVTVLPEGFPQARLPGRLGALVAMSVIGHFDPADRGGMWDLLAERLAPGGRAVLNLQPPAEAVAVPEAQMADVRVGRRAYRGWGRAEPAGAGKVVWHMTYRVYQDEELVQEVQVDYDWWVLGEERLKEELALRDLTASPAGPAELGVYVVTRSRL
ncbi:SAM-dependent methyltransferase [Thermocatellispora tengchongensis]|uniref:SAM-dependent methyltransferase n=1 Tax=Thermocatellispora tengchongensis TaxID=1073253 RepID=A0A840P7D9_9ACTN|nr:class I SAM-dependent methyltransferase [Thermocatellispora tengchongensis]MBB5133360.1 SAM-dependent methyltransferase [Thermocatellispora tengchongensis]